MALVGIYDISIKTEVDDLRVTLKGQNAYTVTGNQK